jgi:hypothetical protein
MIGPRPKSDIICWGQSPNPARPPFSNRCALRSAGSQSEFLGSNPLAERHEPKFLIDILTIRNRHNLNKTKTGADS